MSVIEVSRRGRKQGNPGRLNLEALIEPCRLLLLGGSLSTSKEAMNKILILINEAFMNPEAPGANCPLCTFLSAALLHTCLE